MKKLFRSSEEKKMEQERFMRLSSPLMDELYRTALGMTKNQLDAEDLLQEAYMKAWRFFHSFEQGTNFRAWMYRILTNTYINQYRKKKRQPTQVDLEKVSSFIPDEEPSNKVWITIDEADESGADYHDIFSDAISDALDRLPESFRIIVLLADVSDLKYQEIADLLEIPVGTVMSRLHRGRKMLARTLRGYAEKNSYVSGE